ncbi:MAG: hypothetical protein JO232_22010 [Verrucomicrobia bacterium]|nr:hypothetical protein [Verrucomicrobiota bacterium]
MKLGSAVSPRFFDTYRHLPAGIRAKGGTAIDYSLPTGVKFKAIKPTAISFAQIASRATIAFLMCY